MIINNLWLTNFRTHLNIHIEFNPQVTVIIGPNGSGKSNLMEAIYLLATGKSNRADKIEQMVQWGSEVARVKGLISQSGAELSEVKTPKTRRDAIFSPSKYGATLQDVKYDETHNRPKSPANEDGGIQLLATLTTGTVQGKKTPLKTLEVNGVRRQLRKFAGQLKVVLFGPADMRLIEGSPTRRRSYLDDVLSLIDPEYYRSVLSYQKGLRRRNKVLKAIREGESRREQLFFWDKLLIKEGNLVTRQRQEYINYINNEFSPKQTGELSQLSLHYDHSFISSARLEKYSQAEISSATTLVGPHRDDIVVKNQLAGAKQELSLNIYGSRGQQRLAVLWLKLAALSYIHQETGERPVLLLDDIFSELDHPHRELVNQTIQNQQTIITAADEHLVSNIQNQAIILDE